MRSATGLWQSARSYRCCPPRRNSPTRIRTVSETFESNGSTSMASTCASCMSLMAAGVPIKKMVAGISCGLVTGETDDDFVLLTDIQGLEDSSAIWTSR